MRWETYSYTSCPEPYSLGSPYKTYGVREARCRKDDKKKLLIIDDLSKSEALKLVRAHNKALKEASVV